MVGGIRKDFTVPEKKRRFTSASNLRMLTKRDSIFSYFPIDNSPYQNWTDAYYLKGSCTTSILKGLAKSGFEPKLTAHEAIVLTITLSRWKDLS